MSLRQLFQVLALVPVVFACDLYLGVGEARGYSGSASTAPPSGFSSARPRLAQGSNLQPSGAHWMGAVLALALLSGRRRLGVTSIEASGRSNTGPAFSSNARNFLAKWSDCVIDAG